jgi:hypothetical protein
MAEEHRSGNVAACKTPGAAPFDFKGAVFEFTSVSAKKGHSSFWFSGAPRAEFARGVFDLDFPRPTKKGGLF